MRSQTPLRQAILDLLDELHTLSAPTLLERLHARGITVNKTSVYRALETLIDQEEIYRHSLGSSDIMYERRSHHHDHAVCKKCGKIEKIACQVQLPEQLHQFFPEFHVLTIFGLCRQCHGMLAKSK